MTKRYRYEVDKERMANGNDGFAVFKRTFNDNGTNYAEIVKMFEFESDAIAFKKSLE